MAPACNMPWIESPFFRAELEASGLSPADKQFVRDFAENGYVIIDTGIDPAFLDATREELRPCFGMPTHTATDEHHAQHRLLDAWRFNDKVRQIAGNADILRRLELLYRRRPIPFQTLNFDVGTQQRTHSDMIHFSSIPERFMCGVWLAFEDVGPDNGPLHYYPGSHKLPFYSMTEIGIKASRSKELANVYMDYSDHYEEFIARVAVSQGIPKHTAQVKKGQALIWAANLLHGGEPILRPGSTRWSQVTHYYFEDCVYYTPLFTDFALKDIFLREITDICTGMVVPNKYLGETVPLSDPKQEKSRSLRQRVTDIFSGQSKPAGS